MSQELLIQTPMLELKNAIQFFINLYAKSSYFFTNYPILSAEFYLNAGLPFPGCALMLLFGGVNRMLSEAINTCFQLQKDLLQEKIIIVFLDLSLFGLIELATGNFRQMKKKNKDFRKFTLTRLRTGAK